MKLHVTDNKELVDIVRKALKDNDGFCPCVKDSKGREEYRCLCLHFREKVPVGGVCHCGLYIKDEQ